LFENEEVLTGILALLGLYVVLFWHYARNLITVLDEIAFPSDDPIMTSTLTDDEVFEYPDDEVATDFLDGFAEMDGVPEAEIFTDDAPEEQEDVIEEVMAEEEPEVYTYESDELVYDESRCQGLNKSGRQCGRTPKAGEQYCNQHKQ
jgi:hypothetical protein